VRTADKVYPPRRAIGPFSADLTIILRWLRAGPSYPLLTRRSPTNRNMGTVRMTVARDANNAFMNLRAQAAHILGQALEIDTPSVRRTLLQRSFELLRQAQVAEVDPRPLLSI
jgi:hypothetical protein